jgi:WhiB family redox-sensing transcriptional regulator
MDAAECQGSRIDFVSDNPLETYLAQQVCRRCPVAADCLDYALTRREMRGVWGGLTDEQRRHLAGAR